MRRVFTVLLWSLLSLSLAGQQPAQRPPPSTLRAPTRADILRGEYGRYRANNDLLYYELEVRVDPDKKSIAGTNTVRFKMLKDDTRIQLELYANLAVEKILLGSTPLKYERDLNTVYVDFPDTLRRRTDLRNRRSITRARRRSRAGSAAWPSARTRPDATGSTPPTKAKARACGGRARTNGATSRTAWTSASPCPMA